MTVRIEADRLAELNGPGLDWHRRDFDHAAHGLARRGVDTAAVVEELSRFSVAAPSWALGAGGTRFARFGGPGEPRTTEEKIDDIAALHALTGAVPRVSLHIPWDDPPDPAALREFAASRGIGFDCMNSNTFQDNPTTTGDGKVSYKFGSLAHTDTGVRRAAVEHNCYVVDVGRALGSTATVVWLADGTNHPGQASFRGQFERVLDGLKQIYAHMPQDWRLFVEHKPYEPAFYSSVNPDWGTSLLLAQGCGERAGCIVDLGHHLPNTNVEQVVSRLAMAGRLGGFHLNDSKYGDDDLTVGSIDPYQLFLIFLELVDFGNGRLPPLAYMIDESHNLKDPLEDLIQAVTNTQVALAQSLCVDRTALAAAQDDNDPALAEDVLRAAFLTDVRPLVAEARLRAGAAIDPLRALRDLGYRHAVTAERGSGSGATGL